jgi:hypothetical protein
MLAGPMILASLMLLSAGPAWAQPGVSRERLEWQLRLLDQRRAKVVAQLEQLDAQQDPQRDGPLDADERGGHPAAGDEPEMGEQPERILMQLEAVDPELARRLRLWHEPGVELGHGPGPGDQGPPLRRILPRLMELRDLREHDPELFEASRRELRTGIDIMIAAREVRDARGKPQAETDAAVQRLRAAIAEAFDAKRDGARLEITRLEAQLEQTRRRVAEAESNREGTIDEHLAKALRRLGLEGPPGSGHDRPRGDGGRGG